MERRGQGADVAEIVASGDSVCSVARRHGLSPQLFGWRRQLREAAGGHAQADEAQFVPTLVDAVVPTAHRKREAVRKADSGIIEIEVDGITIRAGRGADTAMIASIGAEGEPVIGPSGAVRMMVATKPVDFRRGMEGLATLVRESMGADPFSGVVYVFRAKRADRIKLVLWDGTGLCLFAKRLEDGIFSKRQAEAVHAA